MDFIVEGERIVITPVRTLKDLRGAVKAAGRGDAVADRAAAKKAVAKRVKDEMA